MLHNSDTIKDFNQPIVVDGKTQHYVDGTVKKHGVKKDGSRRKIRSDSNRQ